MCQKKFLITINTFKFKKNGTLFFFAVCASPLYHHSPEVILYIILYPVEITHLQDALLCSDYLFQLHFKAERKTWNDAGMAPQPSGYKKQSSSKPEWSFHCLY